MRTLLMGVLVFCLTAVCAADVVDVTGNIGANGNGDLVITVVAEDALDSNRVLESITGITVSTNKTWVNPDDDWGPGTGDTDSYFLVDANGSAFDLIGGESFFVPVGNDPLLNTPIDVGQFVITGSGPSFFSFEGTMNTNSLAGDDSQATQVNWTLVPAPGALALLGLGGVFGLSRPRRR